MAGVEEGLAKEEHAEEDGGDDEGEEGPGPDVELVVGWRFGAHGWLVKSKRVKGKSNGEKEEESLARNGISRIPHCKCGAERRTRAERDTSPRAGYRRHRRPEVDGYHGATYAGWGWGKMLWRAAMAVKMPRWARSWSKLPCSTMRPLSRTRMLVHGAEGGEAVGDADDGAVFGEVVDGFLDFGLGLGIERGGGFVEDEDGGVADEGAGDGDALALAAGEALAAFAEGGVVALREGLDEVVGVGFAGGGDDFLARGADFAEGDVFGDGGVEEEDVLADEGEVGAEVGDAEGFERDAVDFDLAGGGIVKAEEEVDEGAFAGAAFAGEAEALAAREVEADVVEDGPSP